jgi:hypothetical protein
MPVDGRLTRMIHVPGALFSVNPATARGVPGLFARNERVVCVFETDFGPFVLVLVGATIVGSMATVWHGTVNPPRSGALREWPTTDQSIVLKKGEEMGRFLLGSTVVMLFPQDTLRFNPAWAPERPIRMGEMMGSKAGGSRASPALTCAWRAHSPGMRTARLLSHLARCTFMHRFSTMYIRVSTVSRGVDFNHDPDIDRGSKDQAAPGSRSCRIRASTLAAEIRLAGSAMDSENFAGAESLTRAVSPPWRCCRRSWPWWSPTGNRGIASHPLPVTAGLQAICLKRWINGGWASKPLARAITAATCALFRWASAAAWSRHRSTVTNSRGSSSLRNSS